MMHKKRVPIISFGRLDRRWLVSHHVSSAHINSKIREKMLFAKRK